MARRSWISVKRGLLEPKHREKIGAAIWLYMYILDRCDWEQGAVLEWKDKGAADDLQMDVNTLRYQRAKLEEHGYIVTERKQYGLKLYVMNWTNPREYSGKVYNPKSSKVSALSNVAIESADEPQSSNQNRNQNRNQISNQIIGGFTTPTSSSNIKHQTSNKRQVATPPHPKPEPVYVDVEDDKPARIKPKVPREKLNPMIGALGDVLRWDMKISTNWSKPAKLAKGLVQAGYAPEDVMRIFGRGGVWYREDWRGKKGDAPTMKDISERIGEYAGRVERAGAETAQERLARRLEALDGD
jgi:hypothetical protein